MVEEGTPESGGNQKTRLPSGWKDCFEDYRVFGQPDSVSVLSEGYPSPKCTIMERVDKGRRAYYTIGGQFVGTENIKKLS